MTRPAIHALLGAGVDSYPLVNVEVFYQDGSSGYEPVKAVSVGIAICDEVNGEVIEVAEA